MLLFDGYYLFAEGLKIGLPFWNQDRVVQHVLLQLSSIHAWLHEAHSTHSSTTPVAVCLRWTYKPSTAVGSHALNRCAMFNLN